MSCAFSVALCLLVGLLPFHGEAFVFHAAQPIQVHHHHYRRLLHVSLRWENAQQRQQPLPAASVDKQAEATATSASIDERLQEIASKIRLDKSRHGMYHLESNDKMYGFQDLQTRIQLNLEKDKDQGLGLVLEELMGDERAGIVCVREVVSGSAASAAYPAIEPGDIIVSVSTPSSSSSSTPGGENGFCETMTGYNYDQTVQALTQAKQAAVEQQQQHGKNDQSAVLVLELNRLVQRAKVQIELTNSGETFEALAGDNLRQVIQRYKQITLGTCGGEGQCGGCLVKICRRQDDDDDNLSQQHHNVQQKKSCQTIIGTDNKPHRLQVTLMPDTDQE